jgi:hypothetical protein
MRTCVVPDDAADRFCREYDEFRNFLRLSPSRPQRNGHNANRIIRRSRAMRCNGARRDRTNPIALAFAKLKALLRATVVRTVNALWNALGDPVAWALTSCSPPDTDAKGVRIRWRMLCIQFSTRGRPRQRVGVAADPALLVIVDDLIRRCSRYPVGLDDKREWATLETAE